MEQVEMMLVDLPDGLRVPVPAQLDGTQVRYVTADISGGVCIWTIDEPPTLDPSGVWMGETEDGVREVFRMLDDGPERYSRFADSLRMVA
ncbi:MAG: hypothetical protein CVU32_01775 [Betaproteobacteria bacterium HGW-Betaproteobacteria-5]|jgi:hypothetical protein|nr:MAG: hypothetical protein CVU32_01775 [Betaproteobacteria bacterium HGW-Betaproteobacteria-5]PKO40141.1 MAG: hypothetical protein CVU33_02985 [Betaproteobacteria bacterium HGW-Betaproteobacteria-6]PKO93198.1 MAG: hypothetical protein CVU16_05840 [Betaproteobacteria bacterium HGW-Betaproteobacteria-10]